MTTDRPYRKALPFERAVAELGKCSGRQFDPKLVDIVLTSDAFRSILTQRWERQAVDEPLSFASQKRRQRRVVGLSP